MRVVSGKCVEIAVVACGPLPGDCGRASLLQASLRAEVSVAADELATVRHKMSRLAAGLRDPEDAPSAPPVAPSVPVIARRARVRAGAWVAGTAIALGALTGTYAAFGGAKAVASLGITPDAGAAPLAGTALAAASAPAFPTFVPPADDPGVTIYAARFAKVSAAEKTCLARAVYYEARGESFEGQVAVAQVVLNRARSQKWPGTLCRVVYQGIERGAKCQFSFACMMHAEPAGDRWEEAQGIAELAVAGRAWLRETIEATYYHATSVAPVWRIGLVTTGTIGSHVFYRDPQGVREANAAKAVTAAAALRPIVRKAVLTAALGRAAGPAASAGQVQANTAASSPASSTTSFSATSAAPVANVARSAQAKVREAKVPGSGEQQVTAQRKKPAVAASEGNWNVNLMQPRF